MIVSFSVENFRSFHAEATLSLIASNRLAGEHGNHAVAVSGTSAKVLRTAVIYGANGAGKSNLFKSLDYLRSLALPFYGRDRESMGREAFRFGGIHDNPSSFDLQFIANGKVYRYVIRVDDRQVVDEWLGEDADSRERALFQRGKERDVVLGSQAREYQRLAALATVGAPPTQSFLSTVAAAALPTADIGPDLTSAIDWFWSVLNLVPPGLSQMPLWRKLNDDPTLLDFASDFLRSSSTGVDRLEIMKSEISREELPNFVGEQRALQLVKEAESGRRRFIKAPRIAGDAWIEVAGSAFRLVRFQSTHKTNDGSTVNLDLEDESDGTRRLLDLLPALHQMQRQGGVYFVDEIDRSMHPILVRRLLEFFLNSCGENPGQMILTTHESSLLDLDLLRRDEIWFAEKDHEQATRLYSLADFKVRNDLEIRKHYLQGRFGAIPFLGSLDRLIKGKDETA
jgi:predicted ATPase